MLHCREISKLVSESMDRELPLRQRLQVWMHLAMCRMCAGFARQLWFLRRAAREHPERLAAGYGHRPKVGPGAAEPEPTLSQEARDRIKAALRGGQE